ncbi:MAG: glycosyltransferase [Geobacter sp.]|nr:glycosyltransferase [Geobacter sp.]
MKNFELSIVIPVLNEAVELPAALQSLVMQKGVDFEVIIVDGGSIDSTLDCLSEIPLPISIVKSTRGRGTQLNCGAAAARGKFMLFLHADSRFTGADALRKSIDLLRLRGDAAGHFQIRFRDYADEDAAGIAWLERKAAVDRAGCAHGDQGLLVGARLFRESGGFDESCQIMAETRFADRMRQDGCWLLLPAEISSSARRFNSEGFRERMTLNMLIMALAHADAEDILARLSEVYSSHDNSTRLDLLPIYRRIKVLLESKGVAAQAAFWLKIGRYVCANAWQVALWLDWKCGSRGWLLGAYDSYLYGFCQKEVIVRLAAGASRIWLLSVAR